MTVAVPILALYFSGVMMTLNRSGDATAMLPEGDT